MKNEYKIEDGVVTMMVNDNPVLFDLVDLPAISPFRWKSSLNRYFNTGYRDEKGVGRTLTLHKLLTGSKHVQHLNGNMLDYRRSNLLSVDKPIVQRERGKYLKGNKYRLEKDTVIIVIKSKNINYEAYADYEDYPLISQYTWCRNVVTGYAQAIDRVTKKGLYMHRLIMESEGFYDKTDHINGNRLDNRKSNLRHCSDSKNHHNNILHKKEDIGVSRHVDGGWDARLQVEGFIYRKYFKTYEEAIAQRRAWEKELNPSGLNGKGNNADARL